MSNNPRRKREPETYRQWWMKRLNELHGFEEEARKLYSLTKIANLTDSWAILKLVFLGNYADMYTSIIQKRIGRACYLETSAGSGLNNVEDVETIIFGSPMIAVRKPRKKFDKYVLIEKDRNYCNALAKLIPYAEVIRGDVNSDETDPNSPNKGLTSALSKIAKNIPILAFVDPFGMDVKWKTLELILKRWSDVIINFQSVSRTVGSIGYNKKYEKPLTDFFGTTKWKTCKTYEDYLELYMSQIKQHKDIVIPIKIQAASGYYYYLIVAVKRTGGNQQWIEVINRTKENVEKADSDDVKKFIDIFRNKQMTLNGLS